MEGPLLRVSWGVLRPFSVTEDNHSFFPQILQSRLFPVGQKVPQRRIRGSRIRESHVPRKVRRSIITTPRLPGSLSQSGRGDSRAACHAGCVRRSRCQKRPEASLTEDIAPEHEPAFQEGVPAVDGPGGVPAPFPSPIASWAADGCLVNGLKHHAAPCHHLSCRLHAVLPFFFF